MGTYRGQRVPSSSRRYYTKPTQRSSTPRKTTTPSSGSSRSWKSGSSGGSGGKTFGGSSSGISSGTMGSITRKRTSPGPSYYTKPQQTVNAPPGMNFVPGRDYGGSPGSGYYTADRKGQADVEIPTVVDLPSAQTPVPISIPEDESIYSRFADSTLEITLPEKGPRSVWEGGGGGGGGSPIYPEDGYDYPSEIVEDGDVPTVLTGAAPILGAVEGYMEDLNNSTGGAGSLLLIAIIIAAGLAMSGEGE